MKTTVIRCLLAVVSIAPSLAAQSSAVKFEVASIRPVTGNNAEADGEEGTTVSPGSLIMRNISLRSALGWAWGLQKFQISGPAWIATEKYSIAAKTGGIEAKELLRKALGTLLEDRFRIASHREIQELPVYELSVAKNGPKLRPSSEPTSLQPSGGTLEFHGFTMSDLAAQLSDRPIRVDRPVLDKTDLSGAYNFTLRFSDTADDLKATLEGLDKGTVVGISIFSIFEQQLGLKLTPHKGPVEMLVIERADKTPAEN